MNKLNWVIFLEIIEKVFLISDDEENKLFNNISKILNQDENIKLIQSKSTLDDLKLNMARDFFVIFIDYDELDCDVHELLHFIKVYLSSLPLIVIISEENPNFTRFGLSDAIFMPNKNVDEMFRKQLVNTIDILRYNRNINDLSHFPGNFVVNDVLNENLEKNKNFTLMYFDIDKFKSFTDYYGLVRANSLLSCLAENINSLVVEYADMKDLIAHVGGDDFVVIFNDYDAARTVGEKLVETFDAMVPEFYDEKDLERGYISVLNRKGVYEDFPLVSLSVTTISNEFKEYHSTEEIYKEMMKIKHEAKQFSGSILLQA